MDTLTEILLSQKLRYVSLVLDTVDPTGPMTESTRIQFAGEATGHDQAAVAALLDAMPTVTSPCTRAEYADTLRTIRARIDGGAR